MTVNLLNCPNCSAPIANHDRCECCGTVFNDSSNKASKSNASKANVDNYTFTICFNGEEYECSILNIEVRAEPRFIPCRGIDGRMTKPSFRRVFEITAVEK